MADIDDTDEKITVPHVPASNFRLCVADSANVTSLFDGVGTVLQLTFTRLDATPVSESFPASKSDQGVRQTGPVKFETPIRKIQEFGVRMRPDHAQKIAQVIMEHLGKLDATQKQRYGISDLVAPAATALAEDVKK